MATANTLRETLVFEGVGLHTGEPCKIRLHPLEPHPPLDGTNTRILLRKNSYTVPARWDYVIDTTRATVLGDGDTKITTVEHLMAALWMTGITHCVIEVLQGNEIPILDGSALPFVEAIRFEPNPPTPPLCSRRGGNAYDSVRDGSPSPLTERGLGGEVPALQAPPSSIPPSPLTERGQGGEVAVVQVHHADRYLALSLSGDTLFGYIQFPEPLGVQAGAFRIEDALTQIAPARTFGFLREVEALQKQGLALGGALDNALVIDETGYHNPARFMDEPLRHKLLDALGDLYLSGVYLRQFTLVAIKPGHALNVQLARQLAQRLNAEANLWRSSD
ncbi:MAG: UDP-3-O-acyl-N-acetylglucosamine deacetylase [Fimbriimonadales bacterium]|nr:UDP-3-O-acyl-N-acetylglucosamine deacetylase [Fimbriimonadales bacterium]